jgi:drug/metabolite transporter (DMT)-like permease
MSDALHPFRAQVFMFELWVPITIAAAFLQNVRSALQKHLTGKLSTAGAAYVRFFYAWPFAIIYCLSLNTFGDFAWPEPNELFFLYIFLGAIAQILFTVFLIWLFSFRNFTVGTTYSKTEVVQVAILGLVILGDTLSLTGIVAIIISFFGVMALSVSQSKISWMNLLKGLTEKPTLIGLASGVFLGASVVFYRGGALSLGGEGFIMQAAFALAVATVIQTVLMGIYLIFREPGQLTAVLKNWPPALMVGIAGVVGSVGWFTAFTIQNAAYVRALGQIELVFMFLTSVFIFKEKSNAMEMLGILAIVTGILILLLGK